jgi:hypothetical protein
MCAEYSYVFLYGSGIKERLFSYTAKLIGFYNRDGVCLLRGTGWFFNPG